MRATSRAPSEFGLNSTVELKRVTIGGGVGNANGRMKTITATTNELTR